MWYEIAQNPKAISSIFGSDEPSLETVEVFKATLERDGPGFTVVFDVKSFPTNPPVKWKQNNFNQVQITLQLWGIEEVDIKGWSTSNVANISIYKLKPQKFIFKLAGSTSSMTLLFQWMQVGVTGYIIEKSLT